jgi:hypothetical protein
MRGGGVVGALMTIVGSADCGTTSAFVGSSVTMETGALNTNGTIPSARFGEELQARMVQSMSDALPFAPQIGSSLDLCMGHMPSLQQSIASAESWGEKARASAGVVATSTISSMVAAKILREISRRCMVWPTQYTRNTAGRRQKNADPDFAAR